MDDPIYHRPGSCGDRNVNFIDKFAINVTDDRSSIYTKKMALKQCYIERTLYDKIYEHVLHKQNLGHLIELRNIERLLPTDIQIYIDVKYNPTTDEPYMVVITTVHGLVKEIEEYEKLGANVKCRLEVIDSQHSQHIFTKTQNFKERHEWSLSRNSPSNSVRLPKSI